MPVLRQIKLNDIAFDLPSVSDTAVSLSSVVAQVGCTADQMTEALKKISELMKQMDWATTEITAIKDSMNDLRYDIDCADAACNARTDLVELQVSELRSVLDAKTENPNQKGGLEISNRIVPSEDFLILGGIGWSGEIIDMDKTNMFLN